LSVTAQNELPKYIPTITGSWWQIANEDYKAGEYSNKPLPGQPTRLDHQQVSDFTIYKADNDKWQLISAVRSTKFPKGAHFFYRWESDDITNPNWEEKGIFYTTNDFPDKAGYATGVFYAPHCIQDNGKYYMFHNSAGTAHLLISDDGINFKPYVDNQDSYILFDAGAAGRDLMVMDNREKNGLWYVYYTSTDSGRTELIERQFTDVYYRTAKHLTGPWSKPGIAGMGLQNRPRMISHSVVDFVNAESPFVLKYNGWYYKFEQTFVTASKDPTNFEGKPVVANMFPHYSYPEEWWPALAPELIIDGGKMYIAYFMNHHEHPLKTLKMGGVFVAELDWVDRE
jgi:hypothetical protein